MQNHGEPSPTQSQSSVAQTKKFAAEVPPFLMTLDSAAGGREEEEIGGVKAGMGGGMSWQDMMIATPVTLKNRYSYPK